MPPRRPLPDLCLIAVLKMLTPNDQLKANKMSPRCAVLVRVANRRVKMLVITSAQSFDGEWTKSRISEFSLSSEPIMQLLPAGGEPFPDYPNTTTRLSKWNCLLVDDGQLFDQPTVEQIVNAFSAVTDLKFDKSVSCENLISMLQLPQWSDQLTNLMVIGYKTDLSTEHRLIIAINALSALQCLAMECYDVPELPDLTILAQLQVMAINVCDDLFAFESFLRCLERQATGNVDLQVHLFCYDPFLYILLGLSEPLRNRIVRFDDLLDWPNDNVPLFCQQFPFLASLSVSCKEAPQLGPLFTALLELPQLVHLELLLDLKREVENQQPPLPLAQLTSVRALRLVLEVRTHSQIQWLNLPVTLPRLQAIHIIDFSCASCGVSLCKYRLNMYSADTEPSFWTALKCFRATLPRLHLGVPHDRVILDYGPKL